MEMICVSFYRVFAIVYIFFNVLKNIFNIKYPNK